MSSHLYDGIIHQHHQQNTRVTPDFSLLIPVCKRADSDQRSVHGWKTILGCVVFGYEIQDESADSILFVIGENHTAWNKQEQDSTDDSADDKNPAQ